jgi:hypothetical protein
MSRDAYATWGAEVASREEANRLAASFPEDVYPGVQFYPSGRMDERRALLTVEDSMRSTMRSHCFTLPDPEPEWVKAFEAVGLTGRWHVWCS